MFDGRSARLPTVPSPLALSSHRIFAGIGMSPDIAVMGIPICSTPVDVKPTRFTPLGLFKRLTEKLRRKGSGRTPVLVRNGAAELDHDGIDG